MKKLLFILGFGLLIGTANTHRAEAQVYVNINIDLHPAWGPSGYDYAEYYYIPEINVYYDVIHRLFIYPNRGRWISTMYLPVAYSYYDFYSLYKVVLNGVLRPWRFNRSHVRLYSSYCYNYHQIPIYYMPEPYYRVARSNYFVWVEPRHMPRNYGRPVYRDYAMNTRNGRISNEMRPSTSTPRREAVTPSRTAPTTRNNATVNNQSANTSRNSAPATTRSTTTTRSNNSVGNSNSNTSRPNASAGSSNSSSTRPNASVSNSNTTRPNASVSSSNSSSSRPSTTVSNNNSSSNTSRNSSSVSSSGANTSRSSSSTTTGSSTSRSDNSSTTSRSSSSRNTSTERENTRR